MIRRALSYAGDSARDAAGVSSVVTGGGAADGATGAVGDRCGARDDWGGLDGSDDDGAVGGEDMLAACWLSGRVHCSVEDMEQSVIRVFQRWGGWKGAWRAW